MKVTLKNTGALARVALKQWVQPYKESFRVHTISYAMLSIIDKQEKQRITVRHV